MRLTKPSLCAGSMVAFSLYGPLFISHLKYTQYEVNAVSVTLELASYLFVPIVGFLTDRFSPRPVVFSSAILFAFGYFLAAYVYQRGPREDGGLPVGVMQLAFVAIGMGTGAQYLSALTATVKNFGRGKHKGLAMALPSAAFGLSAVWQAQVGSQFLREPTLEGVKGDIDAYRYFLFLGGTLAGTGLFASLFMTVVDEEDMIDEGMDELQRSGYLDGSGLERSGLLRRSVIHDAAHHENYGTVSRPTSDTDEDVEDVDTMSNDSQFDNIKKLFLANVETRRFLTDPTMWMLALAFFLATGPVETYINNVGTIIGTIYPPGATISPANDPANHVSILAIASTAARLVGGALTDILAPEEESDLSGLEEFDLQHQKRGKRFTISRVTLMISFNIILVLGFLLLATPVTYRAPEILLPISGLIGIGNGANFAVEPVIISVVWGVQNFGTNFGIVAMTPAIGATVWSAIYSAIYDGAKSEDGFCYGWDCVGPAAVAWTVCTAVSCLCWMYAWKGKGGWARRGILV